MPVPPKKQLVGLLTFSGEKLSYVTHAFRGLIQCIPVNSACTRLPISVTPCLTHVTMFLNYVVLLLQVVAAVTVLTAVARRLDYLVPSTYSLRLLGPARTIRVYPALGTPNDPEVEAEAKVRTVARWPTEVNGIRARFRQMNGVRTLLENTCMLHPVVRLDNCSTLLCANIPLTGPRGPYSMKVR